MAKHFKEFRDFLGLCYSEQGYNKSLEQAAEQTVHKPSNYPSWTLPPILPGSWYKKDMAVFKRWK